MSSESPEVLAFVASQRRRRLRVRLVLALVVAALFTGGAVVVWPLVHPDPCAKLVETICASGGACGALRAAFASGEASPG